jgi:hypothetical protein
MRKLNLMIISKNQFYIFNFLIIKKTTYLISIVDIIHKSIF